MRFLLLFMIAMVSLVLQTAVFNKLTLAGAKPDLLLITVVFFAFIKGARAGAGLGFFYGLLEDLAAGRFIGLNALAKAATGFLVGLTEGKIYKENLLAPGLLIIAASLINGLIVTVLLKITGIPVSFTESFWRILLPVAIYNLGIAPLFYLKFYQSVTNGLLSSKK
jgi:rod shape-determining protein MreD